MCVYACHISSVLDGKNFEQVKDFTSSKLRGFGAIFHIGAIFSHWRQLSAVFVRLFSSISKYTHIHMPTHICKRLGSYVCVYIYIYIYVCMYICIYVCMYEWIQARWTHTWAHNQACCATDSMSQLHVADVFPQVPNDMRMYVCFHVCM